MPKNKMRPSGDAVKAAAIGHADSKLKSEGGKPLDQANVGKDVNEQNEQLIVERQKNAFLMNAIGGREVIKITVAVPQLDQALNLLNNLNASIKQGLDVTKAVEVANNQMQQQKGTASANPNEATLNVEVLVKTKETLAKSAPETDQEERVVNKPRQS